jgi:hypothetical protein
MPVIGTLPNNLQNGTTADATQVMADLNFIVNQVNANANPVGTLTAPSGTRAVFQQATAPVGWTVDTSSSFMDASVRFMSGPGFGNGGTTGWSAWNFGGQFSLNAFTLSIAQLPAHSHPVSDPGHVHPVSDPGHVHPASSGRFIVSGGGVNTFNGGGAAGIGDIATATTGITVSNANTGISTTNTGSGASIQPTFNTPQVKYADIIVGIKT